MLNLRLKFLRYITFGIAGMTVLLLAYIGLAVRNIWFSESGIDEVFNFVIPWIFLPAMIVAGAIAVIDTVHMWRRTQEHLKVREEKLTRAHKMYCVVSREALAKMKGIRGKMMAQAGHAFLHAFWDAEKRFGVGPEAYRSSNHAYKITLAVDTDAELIALEAAYRPICGVSLVKDAGFTVFNEPTITCLGIGPLTDEEKGDDLKALKTLT